mgnify:CR=1 FL=1
MDKKQVASINSSENEKLNFKSLNQLFEKSLLGDQKLANLPLFLRRQQLMRILFFQELYTKILNVHGVLMEFGCRWGTNLSVMTALRGIYEPYNHNRKIIGFDTFTGLTKISDTKDKPSDFIQEGSYSTAKDYPNELRQILSCLEKECPLSHIQKFDIIEGDVNLSLPTYLEKNPQTIIAFAYLDMDIYEPTKFVLEKILPFLTKGSVIGFDEMNWDVCPGPTKALDEVIGLSNCRIMRSPLQPIPGYIIIE